MILRFLILRTEEALVWLLCCYSFLCHRFSHIFRSPSKSHHHHLRRFSRSKLTLKAKAAKKLTLNLGENTEICNCWWQSFVLQSKKLTIGIEHRVQSSASEAVPETTVTKPPQPGGKGLLRNENKTVWEKLYIPTLQWKNGTLIFLTRKLIRRSIFHNKILVLRLKYNRNPKS